MAKKKPISLEVILLFVLFYLCALGVGDLVCIPTWFWNSTFVAIISMVLVNHPVLFHGLTLVLFYGQSYLSKLLSHSILLNVNRPRPKIRHPGYPYPQRNSRSRNRVSPFDLIPHVFLVSVLIFVIIPSVSASAIPDISSIEPRDLTDPSNSELLLNTIAFGCCAVVSFLLRLTNKFYFEKKWQYEDYCMSIAMIAYIIEMILINFSGHYATNLYEPADAAAIFSDPHDVESRILGSKIVIGLEQSMLVVTWGVKLCIWFFLMRVCQGVQKYERWLWALLFYIVAGYLTVMVTYYGIVCRPFKQYWAMPVENSECATYHKYSIVQMTFNLSSDLALFGLPVILVYNTQASLYKKSILLIPFSLGGATIAFAVMNKYYNFSSPLTTVYALWYIREASIAVIVGNLICSWKLVKKLLHAPNINLRRSDNEFGQQQQIAVPRSLGHVLGANGTVYRDGERVVRRAHDPSDEDDTLQPPPPPLPSQVQSASSGQSSEQSSAGKGAAGIV